jgi:hypothetical protein
MKRRSGSLQSPDFPLEPAPKAEIRGRKDLSAKRGSQVGRCIASSEIVMHGNKIIIDPTLLIIRLTLRNVGVDQ